jgi:very-short-patch-repair endonuclease
VEIDGMSHDGQAARDEKRTAILNAQGLHVIRFTNDEVLQSLEAVAVSIARELGLDW